MPAQITLPGFFNLHIIGVRHVTFPDVVFHLPQTPWCTYNMPKPWGESYSDFDCSPVKNHATVATDANLA